MYMKKPIFYIWWFQIFLPHNVVTLGHFSPHQNKSLCISRSGFFMLNGAKEMNVIFSSSLPICRVFFHFVMPRYVLGPCYPRFEHARGVEGYITCYLACYVWLRVQIMPCHVRSRVQNMPGCHLRKYGWGQMGRLEGKIAAVLLYRLHSFHLLNLSLTLAFAPSKTRGKAWGLVSQCSFYHPFHRTLQCIRGALRSSNYKKNLKPELLQETGKSDTPHVKHPRIGFGVLVVGFYSSLWGFRAFTSLTHIAFTPTFLLRFLVFVVCSLQSAALTAGVSTCKESTGTLLLLRLLLLCVPYLHLTGLDTNLLTLMYGIRHSLSLVVCLPINNDEFTRQGREHRL